MTAMKRFLSLLFGGILGGVACAAKDSLQTGTSVSHFYEARSLFINPAALSYESELNGTHFLSSFSWGSRGNENELAAALSWGGLGLGIDRQWLNSEPRVRYSLAGALALNPWLFVGNRIGITRSTGISEGFTQWDLGFQWRPSSAFALGALVNRLSSSPSFSFGVTLKPAARLMLFADFETPSQGFGRQWNYQSTASFEIFRGLYFQTGYDKVQKSHFGFQWDLGKSSLFGTVRSEAGEKTYIAHAQFVPFEKSSFVTAKRTMEITLDSSLKETKWSPSLFMASEPCFSEVLNQIYSSVSQPDIESISLEIKSFPLGLGSALELHEALWRARKAGKIIHVSLENARLKDYLIASAGHSILLAPSSTLEWSLPKSERYYLKGTLEKLGMEAEIVAQGAYKSAPESLTLKKASSKSRENIEQNLKEAEGEIKKAIQRSGRVTDERWEKALRTGLISPGEALKLGLIDKIQVFQNGDSDRSSHWQQDLSLPPQIALISASGDIVRDKMRLLGFLGGGQITPEEVSQQVEIAKKDPRIRAVVFRVNSGGGDVLASHLIAQQVEALAKVKPVIISMGDVAASGGYFISAPAHAVVASPLTLTGSIGVFSGKPNLSGLYKKIDLNKEIITRSPYPGLFDESEKWTPSEREVIQKQVSYYYQNFLEFVSSHRTIPLDQMDRVAQGRVWFGGKALQHKLVDDLGGLSRALQLAQQKAGMDRFSLKVLAPRGRFLDSLSEAFFVKQHTEEKLFAEKTPYTALKPSFISDQPLLYWWDQKIE